MFAKFTNLFSRETVPNPIRLPDGHQHQWLEHSQDADTLDLPQRNDISASALDGEIIETSEEVNPLRSSSLQSTADTHRQMDSIQNVCEFSQIIVGATFDSVVSARIDAQNSQNALLSSPVSATINMYNLHDLEAAIMSRSNYW